MTAVLIDLTLRGTLVTVLTVLFDQVLGQTLHPRWRRAWWMLAAFAWILPLHLPPISILQPLALPNFPKVFPQVFAVTTDTPSTSTAQLVSSISGGSILCGIWLLGTLTILTYLLLHTIATARRWNPERLCTEPELLNLLEDCKAAAGVTAPIGLVIVPSLSSPALLGWLRPRILIPEPLLRSVSHQQLRGILLHELAHFRSADIPLNWCYTIGLSLHWFNPLIYLALHRWRRFREIDADAKALSWMSVEVREAYGEALLNTLRVSDEMPVPRGALALGESFKHMKERLRLLDRTSSTRKCRSWSAVLVSTVLLLVIILPSSARTMVVANAEEATAVGSALIQAEQMIRLIDEHRYLDSWNCFSIYGKQQINAEKWSALCEQVRTPIGHCIQRNRRNSAYQTELPGPAGGTIKGHFITINYESSYEQLASAREDLCLLKDPDGSWRVLFYSIIPR